MDTQTSLIGKCGVTLHLLCLSRPARDYKHLADLWELEEWISPEAAQQARKNYAAYSVQRQDGLRVVTLNTDFCEAVYLSPRVMLTRVAGFQYVKCHE